MRGSVRADVFKRGKRVDLPSPERERVADQLARLGLIDVERYDVVLCVNPLDHDQKYLKDQSCAGRVRLRPDFDEDDNAYQCPDCARVIYPRKKRKQRMMRTRPKIEAMRCLVERLLAPMGVPMREAPEGLFRLDGSNGEVQVALADACRERAVFAANYPRAESIVFVVGNERDLGRWVQNGARSFHLVDLALGDATAAFQREVRRLLRLDDGASAEAAVFGLAGMPPMVAATPVVAANPYPKATQLPVTAGSRWNQVDVHIVDGHTVSIRAPGVSPRSLDFKQLGMADQRSGKPTKKWDIFYELCEHNGRRPWTDRPNRFPAFKQHVSELRPLLQHIFRIDAEPFLDCSRENGLVASFVARPEAPDDTYVGDVWQ